MRIAQQYLAALARDWDTTLDALKDHLDSHLQERELEGEQDS